MKSYGLSRRGSQHQVDDKLFRQLILQELDGPGCLLGYWALWRKLQLKYSIRTPRSTVQTLLRELDPEGSRLRQIHRLKRREYLNPGTNYCWHADGYDKLKPYGFPVHGCIDGFSRRILWLKVTKSNNDPRIIGDFFLNATLERDGCPTLIRTDRGTENGIMATIRCFLRRNDTDSQSGINAHSYGSSHSNQRTEAWWAYLRHSWSSWWIDFFKDMVDGGSLDLSDKLHCECLWFCFSKLIQNELDQVREHWNSHYIRVSRYHTPSGIPDQLYFMPESVNAMDHIKVFDSNDLAEVRNELASPQTKQAKNGNESDDYNLYFEMVAQTFNMPEPLNWKEGLDAYNRRMSVAVD